MLTKSEIKNLQERVTKLDASPVGDFVSDVVKLLPKELGDRLTKFGQHERYHWHRLLDEFTDEELEVLLKAIKQVAPNFPPTCKSPTFEGIPITHALFFDAVIIKAGREGAKKYRAKDQGFTVLEGDRDNAGSAW